MAARSISGTTRRRRSARRAHYRPVVVLGEVGIVAKSSAVAVNAGRDVGTAPLAGRADDEHNRTRVSTSAPSSSSTVKEADIRRGSKSYGMPRARQCAEWLIVPRRPHRRRRPRHPPAGCRYRDRWRVVAGSRGGVVAVAAPRCAAWSHVGQTAGAECHGCQLRVLARVGATVAKGRKGDGAPVRSRCERPRARPPQWTRHEWPRGDREVGEAHRADFNDLRHKARKAYRQHRGRAAVVVGDGFAGGWW